MSNLNTVMFSRNFLRRLTNHEKFVSNQNLSRHCESDATQTATKTIIKSDASLIEEVKDMFDNDLRHRKHPGVRHQKCIELPALMETAVHRILRRYDNKRFRFDASKFKARMVHKKFPYEQNEIREFANEFKELEAMKVPIDECMSKEDMEQVNAKIEAKAAKKLQNKIASNTFVEYTEYNSALYLATQLVPNYAALLSVFREIQMDDPSFKPKTLFDFGSGLGTTMWAANHVWRNSLSEHFNVEAAEAMIDISRLLLQLGKEENPYHFKGVFFRQFLPVSSYIKYDLVVSAFSMLDLPSASARAHVIENLWEKTQDVLVIVEKGNLTGFAAVLEARNFILEKTGHDVTSTFHVHPEDVSVVESSPDLQPTSHIVAPCPHHYPCPRQFTGGPVLCNFLTTYMPLDIGQEMYGAEKEYFSYIVLRKGAKQMSGVPSWPRLVEPCKKRGEHVVCKLCAADGKIHDITFTKSKHKGHLYRCARVSEHGDLLPVTVEEFEKVVKVKQKKKNDEHSVDES